MTTTEPEAREPFEPATFQSFLEQFTKGLQVTASLTQSIHSLHAEVSQHATLLHSCVLQNEVFRKEVAALSSLIRGEGMGDSLYKAFILMERRIQDLERDAHEAREAVKEHKRLLAPRHIALWTAGISLFLLLIQMIMSPVFVKLLK